LRTEDAGSRIVEIMQLRVIVEILQVGVIVEILQVGVIKVNIVAYSAIVSGKGC